MKNLTLLVLMIVVFSCSSKTNTSQTDKKRNQEIWYAQPATKWMEALPVGNGRLGAMVFGDPKHERIQLNEDSLWPGGPDWGNSKGNKEDLEEIRQLLKEGKAHEVDKLIVEKFSYKSTVRSHQTMGDLFIDFDSVTKIENYKRSLDFNDALVKTIYNADGYEVTQQIFTSNSDDVMVIQLKTNNPDGMNFSLKMNRPEDKGHQTVTVNNPSENYIS